MERVVVGEPDGDGDEGHRQDSHQQVQAPGPLHKLKQDKTGSQRDQLAENSKTETCSSQEAETSGQNISDCWTDDDLRRLALPKNVTRRPRKTASQTAKNEIAPQ